MILLGGLIAASVTFGTALLIHTRYNQTVTESKRQLRSLSLVLGDQVERSFQAIEVVQNMAIGRMNAAGMTSAPALKAIGSSLEWNDILKDWAATSSNIRSLAIIDDAGNVVNSSRMWPIPAVNVADRDYFQAPKGDGGSTTFISQPVQARATQAWTVFVSRRLVSPDGTFIGLLTASILLEDLETFYRSISTDDDMAIALFRRDGTLIARFPRVDALLGKVYTGQNTVLDTVRSSSEKVARQTSMIDGIDRYIAGKALDRVPLIVSVSSTVKGALSSWRYQAIQMIIAALLVDLAVLIASVLVLSRFRSSERTAREAGYLARHDALTGLPNRLLFNEQIEVAAARFRRSGERYAVLVADLDRFKDVNDALGHMVGDDLLRAVSALLTPVLGADDTLARTGGDEFAIIQSSIRSRDDVESLAAKLAKALAGPFDIRGNQILIGLSIGAAIMPETGTDSERLLRSADLALHRAKATGRRAFQMFSPEMEAALSTRRLLERDLRQALVHDQLELFYQPLVNLRTQRVEAFEALIRWKHPEQGYISPADFIPIAEETGLIGPIGEWVLATACKEATTWPSSIRVSVNLSPVQFRFGSIVSGVWNALQSSDLRPDRLEIEITESVSLEEHSSAGDALHQLKALGASIALDDFGTGYSSLSYLRKFPFDKIKIDRSFVQEMETSSDCAAIVGSTVSLAGRLGMVTTAEGVETVEQLNALRALGCTQVQGYLISRPMSADRVPAFLASKPPRLELVA